ncbi:MAG TPA: superoxide dismutase [Cu-Zn] SodC2, partial [Methylophaga sp.]|nr:superoxide dismutase [Cu-Zn] SodC2 [Methylophaga sp.]
MKILTSIIVALASSAAMAETQVELFEVDKQGTGKSLGSV